MIRSPLSAHLALLLFLCACASNERRADTGDGTNSSAHRTAVHATTGDGGATEKSIPEVRRVAFTYEATITEIPDRAKSLSVWIPAPRHESPVQTVLNANLEVRGRPDAEVTSHQDAERGNRWWHASIPNPKAPVTLRQTMVVERQELLNNHFRGAGNQPLAAADAARFEEELGPYELVPTDGRMEVLAKSVAPAETNVVNLARGIYDYVLGHMRYSKDGTGWGRGDANWACDSGFGNCTDFHSLFMSVAKVRGIPTRFHMGFPLPPEEKEGQVGGYHCWAEFYVPELGWVPVDISEADKHPDHVQYYFGALTEDRIDFTIGRDLLLEPKPAKGKLNYFIYPHAEVDGAEVKVERKFTFTDIPARSGG